MCIISIQFPRSFQSRSWHASSDLGWYLCNASIYISHAHNTSSCCSGPLPCAICVAFVRARVALEITCRQAAALLSNAPTAQERTRVCVRDREARAFARDRETLCMRARARERASFARVIGRVQPQSQQPQQPQPAQVNAMPVIRF